MDNSKKTDKPKKNIKDIECFNCREKDTTRHVAHIT